MVNEDNFSFGCTSAAAKMNGKYDKKMADNDKIAVIKLSKIRPLFTPLTPFALRAVFTPNSMQKPRSVYTERGKNPSFIRPLFLV